jgi:hypothetical protein
MAGYLRRFVGTYEVRADYDLDTNDFPRDASGVIDPSFDDYYINCANGIKIRHATGSTLSCYIPSVKRGMGILQLLADSVHIGETDILDGEIYFTFSVNDIDIVAKVCKAKTKGKNIQPLSPTTLPKRKSVVPENEIARYKKLFSQLSGETPLQKGRVIKDINKQFTEQLPSTWKADMKRDTLDFRSYVYYIGKWEDYLDTIKENTRV